MMETKNIVLMPLDVFPLKTNATTVKGNDLQINWEKVIHREQLRLLDYLMG